MLCLVTLIDNAKIAEFIDSAKRKQMDILNNYNNRPLVFH